MDIQRIGKEVVALRKLEGVSQQTLANAIGVSRATINALEKGSSHDVGVCKVIRALKY